MKKMILMMIVSVLLLTSCGTYMGQGAFVGGQFGAIIGSAIGGITDGPRGSDVGTIVGMAGGAVLGAVVGNAADEAEARRYEQYQQDRQRRHARVLEGTRADDVDDDDQGYFDPNNGGNDIIEIEGMTPPPAGTTVTPPATTVTPPATTVTPPATSPVPVRSRDLTILNAHFEDDNGDGVLVAGEQCRVSFEIVNRTGRTVYDVQPLVYDLTNNKHIHISQNLHIESILPGKGIRYTATIKGDTRLREGTARIRLGVAQGNREVESQSREFVIPTKKR